MICVNCGSIPPPLVESTLFGHERGAFTTAVQQHKGVFEAADGGTVFLDEIGELPLAAQAALLRVLESKRIVRVGSTREIEVDVRVIAATHQDLESMKDAGTFRKDFFFRLNGMMLKIPPLRARREDIEPLIQRFLEEANRANGRGIRGVEDSALALLEGYSWPGNIRELKNAIERAVVIAEGDVITAADLPEAIRGSETRSPEDGASADEDAAGPAAGGKAGRRERGTMKSRVERAEHDAIRQTRCERPTATPAEAARILEMPLRTLQHKMKAYGIKRGYGLGE